MSSMEPQAELPKKTVTEEEMMNAIYKITSMFLLYERSQDTQIRTAFSMLVQERHNEFHTLGDRKTGNNSSYEDCDNEICIASAKMINETKTMSIDITDLTIQL